jgi:hypothetical protein
MLNPNLKFGYDQLRVIAGGGGDKSLPGLAFSINWD